jgi:pyruvate dehydrogenase E2 component (dihydrolipoamide acetyltransferase)
VALREKLRLALSAKGVLVPTFTALFVKLTAAALQEHPLLNARLTEKEIILQKNIHIAVAVDTEAGLLVPVIRNVQTKSSQQIAEELYSLARRARARELEPDDLQGGTFTISNLGAFGIDAFTPIINLPQCAILGFGRIIAKPVVLNDQILPRKVLTLNLTHDHRLVDGAPAARFLNTIRGFVEQPSLWIVN